MLTTITHTEEAAFLHSIIAAVNTHLYTSIHNKNWFLFKKTNFSCN